MTSREQVREEIARVIYESLSGKYGDFAWPGEAADALLAEYPFLAGVNGEAVEAGARALYEATYSHGIPPRPWSNISQDWETQYKRKTRAVLSAVLGKEQSDEWA